MSLRRCLDCGILIHNGSRCPVHERAHHQQRRGTRQQQGYGPEWQQVRLIILERDDYTCQLRRPGCTMVADTVDHVIPISRGGTMAETNLIAACLHCNSGKRTGT